MFALLGFTKNSFHTVLKSVYKPNWFDIFVGQECYFVATLVENAVVGHLYVGVQWATTTLTAAQSFDAKNELQLVDFNAAYKDETQVALDIKRVLFYLWILSLQSTPRE